MATEYKGFPTNITVASAVSIASSTNASPIVVTTSAPHLLATGDAVIINAHATNTSANGVWPTVMVLSPTTFSIPVAGVGVGGATGMVQSLDLGISDLPEDAVDFRDASSVNVPFEANFDRTAFQWAQYYLGLRRPGILLPNADTSVHYVTDLLYVPDVTAARLYNLPSPILPAPFNGRRVRFRFVREVAANAADAVIQYSGTPLAILPGLSDGSWAEVETSEAGTGYTVTAWGGATTL